MGLDPSTSFVAALLSPAVSRFVASKTGRRRFITGRVHLLDQARWIKRLDIHNRPISQWTEDDIQHNDDISLNQAGLGHPSQCSLCSACWNWEGVVLTGIVLTGPLQSTAPSHEEGCKGQFSEVVQIARFRGIPSVEEEVKERIKEVEAGVDSVIESYTPEDASLTKEEIAKQDALIREVWETINTSYYNERDPTFSKEKWAKLRDEALRQKAKTKHSVYKVIRSMIAKGLRDPYAKLISAEEFRSMQKYDMTGVGLNVGSSEEFYQKVTSKMPGGRRRDGGIWVMGILKGSPAEQAGMQQGDRILEIDGKPVTGSSYEVAQKIKGTSAQPVTLKIRRKENEDVHVQMDRATHRVMPAVKTTTERMGIRKVGRIRVMGCNSEARQDILHGLDQLRKAKVHDLILDLSGNPGGLVEEAVEIAKLFLDKGATVYIKRDGAEGHETRVVSHQPAVTDMRLMVLVDQRTASAAEIIAGAIQDNCRGVVAGERTFGKGLIQSVFQLSDGSGLTLTVGKYYTPNMTDIDQSGIDPDFRKLPQPAKADRALNACMLRRERRTM